MKAGRLPARETSPASDVQQAATLLALLVVRAFVALCECVTRNAPGRPWV